jgi:hypothetical protein
MSLLYKVKNGFIFLWTTISRNAEQTQPLSDAVKVLVKGLMNYPEEDFRGFDTMAL